jgi:Spy/CpxP family protein refolding chaperone
MRRFILLMLAFFVLIGVAGPALSFDNPDVTDRYQEEVKRKKLGPALDVDQRTVNQLLQIDHKYRPLKEKAKQEAVTAFRDLQQVMRHPSPPENQVRAILDKMIKSRRETLNLQQRQLEDEMAILTPVQQARYLMFLMSLRKQMAQEALNLRSGPKASKPMAPPRELPVVRPGP